MKPEYDFSKARRGAIVPAAPGKTRITIRLDTDVIDWFKAQVNNAGGGNYQSLINEALKSHIQQYGLERTLRKVIREELRRVASNVGQPSCQQDAPARGFSFMTGAVRRVSSTSRRHSRCLRIINPFPVVA
jgi:hypothetical protein